MSKLKISENLFLEKNELVKAQTFFTTEGWQRAVRSLIKKFGVVQNVDLSSFAVVSSASANSVDVLPGLAYNTAMEAIVSVNRVTVPIGAAVTGQDKWIVLRRAITNNEIGTVAIQTDGSLTGTGTEFTKVLRGQPNFPTKVRFTTSAQNVYEYEVVSVVSDTSAVLSGSFTAETGLRYSVVGTFTPGFIPSAGDKEIYEYDHFEIEVINSASRPEVGVDEFIIAQLAYSSENSYSIVDLRGDCAFSAETVVNDNDSVGQNPFVSLLALRQVGGTLLGERFGRIELLIEYSYKVESFNYISTENGWLLTVLSGSCNAVGTAPSSFPNGMFDGFIVINRDNMRSVKILSQQGNRFTIENRKDAAKLLSDNSDLIIVPDFTHLEVAVSLDSNVLMTNVPFTKETGAADGRLRMTIDVEYPDGEDVSLASTVNLKLKYRMFSSEGYRGYPFTFNAATYHDYTDDTDKTSVAGDVILNVDEMVPTGDQRNYS